MDRTTAYAKLIVEGGKTCGRTEYLACKRHLDDMARGEDYLYTFDAAIAERHIELANKLTIGEGNNPRQLKTRGFQNFIIGSLFGWRRKRSRERRYREAYVQMARQNGKSFLAGEMCNDFATFSGYRYGKIFCTATKQEQANIVWEETAKFIESDRDLAELYKIRKYDRTITSLVTGTTIKAIGRDTKSADGFRSILAVTDELHAHPNNQMYKLMIDGQINVDALTLAITTAGFNLNSFCYEHYQFCKKVLTGAIEKESLFVYIAELDEDDDIWNPENWAKANPLLLWNDDETLNKDMLARMAEKAIDAREKGGAELVNFLTKSLNRWVTYGGNSYIDADKWRACGCDLRLADMRGRECYLGIDLSSGGDLTSIALVFPPMAGDDKVYIWSHSYLPELRLAEHERTDDVPYRLWATANQLTLTSGMYGIKLDLKAIIETLQSLLANYNLKIIGVGYDPHNIAGILADLEQILPCDLTEIPQSARSLNDATQDFKLSVDAGIIQYDRKNALLTWSVLNAVLNAPNSFGEVKIDKMSKRNRIDAIDAILDAYKLFLTDKDNRNSEGEEALEAWLSALNRGREK